jgi:uncharacterized protein YggE
MRVASVFVTGGLIMVAFSLSAQMPSMSQPPQIVTTGVGEASAVPDRATLYIAVQTRASSVGPASTENARRVRAVMDTLHSAGITTDQLETANYNVSPEMLYPANQPPRPSGYTVTNSILVRLRRIEDVGRVIDAALGKGANEISSLQFSSSKADSVRSVALAAAVVDARAQAEAMARAAGGSLGALLELNTSSVPVRPMPLMQSLAMRAGPTPITPGQQTVSATVTGRWTFVAGR